MWFSLNWNNGYEVGVNMPDEQGYIKYHPLRNFGEHQGDAKLFQLVDCPKLTDLQLRMLIKNYSPTTHCRRGDGGKRFIKETK